MPFFYAVYCLRLVNQPTFVLPWYNSLDQLMSLQTQVFDSMECTMLRSRFSQLWIVPFPFLEWMFFNGEHPLCVQTVLVFLYCYTSDSASDLQCYRYQELPTFARASVQCHGEGSRNQKVCMCVFHSIFYLTLCLCICVMVMFPVCSAHVWCNYQLYR